MEVYIDHYIVLGLPSGIEGSKISEKDITKAYRLKALELHPDKRPHDDSNAVTDFQNLQASYEILKDEKTRKAFDDDIIRRQKLQEKHEQDFMPPGTSSSSMYDYEQKPSKPWRMTSDFEERKRRRTMSDLDERYCQRNRAAAFASNVFHNLVHLKQQQKIFYDLIRLSNSMGEGCSAINKEKMLKVSWAKVGFGLDYTIERLREVFETFGKVQHVIMSSNKNGLALIVMATNTIEDASVAAIGIVCGDFSNPLLVTPLG